MHVKFAPLPVDDFDRAIAFYTGKVGLTLATDAPYGDDGRWVELAFPGGETRLLVQKGSPDRDRSKPSLILVVDFIEADYRRLADAGVSFLHEPKAGAWLPDQLYSLFHDSEGNLVMIVSD